MPLFTEPIIEVNKLAILTFIGYLILIFILAIIVLSSTWYLYFQNIELKNQIKYLNTLVIETSTLPDYGIMDYPYKARRKDIKRKPQ